MYLEHTMRKSSALNRPIFHNRIVFVLFENRVRGGFTRDALLELPKLWFLFPFGMNSLIQMHWKLIYSKGTVSVYLAVSFAIKGRWFRAFRDFRTFAVVSDRFAMIVTYLPERIIWNTIIIADNWLFMEIFLRLE